MSFIKPATPGFITTLTAAVLLAVVSFSVPYFHSVFFLKASLSDEGQSGDITFGTLGYCITVNNATTCSNATVGYELNVNKLVGNDLPVQIPQVVVKWLTYALVLHIVALGLAAVSALFGLLAHVREMSMTCFSSCISGLGATVALVAFLFDIAFFFIVKSRINKVKGGSASLGNAIWLTLAAWILLFFSGCFYGIGRCCIRRRPRNSWNGAKDVPGSEGGNSYAEQMRLDAVKAEADRKARQQREVGLPAFQEYDPSQPLRPKFDEVSGDEDDSDPYHDNNSQKLHNQPTGSTGYSGGYVPGTPGSRAVDEYNSSARTTDSSSSSSYPPQSRRQNSRRTQATTGYEGSYYGHAATTPAPAVNNQYMSTTPYQGYDQYPSGQDYGHPQGGTLYHSTAPQQLPSTQYDRYNSLPPPQPQYDLYNPTPQVPTQYHEPGFSSGTNNTALLAAAGIPTQPTDHYANPYPSQPTSAQQIDRSYSLGGQGYDSGYGANPTADHTQHDDNQFFPTPYDNQPYPSSPPQLSSSPAPINTNVTASITNPVMGPRTIGSPVHQYSDRPPSYDNGPSRPPGVWREKR